MRPPARATSALGVSDRGARSDWPSRVEGEAERGLDADATGEYLRLEAERPGIPIHTAGRVREFVRDHGHELLRRSVALCRLFGIEDFPYEAVRLTVLRLLARGAPIADRGPRSAERYALVVLRRLCVDERRRRALEDHAAVLVRAGSIETDDSVERLRADLLIELGPTGDPGRLLRAALCGFEYLPAHVDPARPTAAQSLRAYWLGCVERADDGEIARSLASPQINAKTARWGKRLLLGWLHALCGAGPRRADEEATYQSAWHLGFEAGQSFLLEHPDWWTLGPSRPGGGRARR